MSIEVTKIENENKGIIKFKSDKLRILQLTDIHLGGSLLTKKLDQLALDAVMKVVKAANPDFNWRYGLSDANVWSLTK